MRALIFSVMAVAAVAVLLTGCRKSEPETTGDSSNEAVEPSPTASPELTPVVYTTFYPMTYFTERIGGDLVKVVCPLPPGADPIFWQPDRETIAEYQQADLIVINGAEFEKWVLTATLPDNRVVDTTAGLSGEFITYETTTHAHGMTGKHTHEGIDGHTWLDPINARRQADVIRQALVKRLPEHENELDSNFQALADELDGLNQRLEAMTPNVMRARVLCSHPAYNYLARRYGWTIKNVALDPAAILTDDQLKMLEGVTSIDDEVRVMLWESEPADETVSLLRDGFEIRSVVFSPAESLDAEAEANGEDYMTIMNANVARLQQALR